MPISKNNMKDKFGLQSNCDLADIFLVILILLIIEAHYLVLCQCLLTNAVSALKEDSHSCNLKGASSELS